MERRIEEVFKDVDTPTLELLDKMLTLDPSKRISAEDALKESYFFTDPLPSDPKSLPKYESSYRDQPAYSTGSNIPCEQPKDKSHISSDSGSSHDSQKSPRKRVREETAKDQVEPPTKRAGH
ncbi:cyclin-dependent kinase C-2-like [Magnolia sinica]|uniref:cyclin-dependent kinase C-2-like n=1 Tax=Magnolia sinica TaxID=86752 RepID=UPI00265836A4|nr:cyclin-dependent kinase C-2-like [Magnolia sinica]